MSTVAAISPLPARTLPGSARLFAAVAIVVATASCLLAGWAPLGFSIVTVFLFAGPHNWMEARYMFNRMPARWGPLRSYYLTGICGVLTLTTAFAALPWLTHKLNLSEEGWLAALAIWNTVLVLWLLTLTQLRSRQNPRRAWAWLIPAAFLLIAAAWIWPRPWDLALVYLHPLVALCFLDRELKSRRPEWQVAYRRVLLLLPLLLCGLWWRLASQPSLPGADALSLRITQHAGSDILPGVSSHLLVATHVFLETIHYSVWLLVVPLVSLTAKPWQIRQVPLARRSGGWRLFVGGALALGTLAVLGFWCGFLADYPLTRDVYFTVAMLHVLAEAPFLLRLL